MQPFRLLVRGVFPRERLDVTYANTGVNYPAEAANYIQGVWQRKLTSGKVCENEKLFRVVSHRINGQKLFLQLEDTSYKDFAGSREKAFISKWGVRLTANPLSVGAAVITSENQIIIGKRRSDLDLNPGKYSIIAGAMNREKDWTDDKPDPFGAILRELFEEKGIRTNEVEQILSLGLVYSSEYEQTYMPFQIKLRALLKVSIPKDYEFEEFFFIDLEQDAVATFIEEKENQMSQTCLANLLLLGGKEFGDAWLKSVLSKLKLDGGWNGG